MASNTTSCKSRKTTSIAAAMEDDRDLRVDCLIEEQRWEEVYQTFNEFPALVKTLATGEKQKKYGWTRLHWLCSLASAPPALIHLVASLNPSATTVRDKLHGDTPLHIACRNSITSAEKVRILLNQMKRTKMMKDASSSGEEERAVAVAVDAGAVSAGVIRNRFGATALHSACNHNAICSVLQLLVQEYPQLLQARTINGTHAVDALYQAYISTIQGHMCIARIVKGEVVEDGHLERFWKKVEFLATEYYFWTNSTADTTCRAKQQPQQDSGCSNDADTSIGRNAYVLHGLLRCNVDVNLFKLAVVRNPASALTLDSMGNLPLHVILETRPFIRLNKERQAIVALIQAAPEAVSKKNYAGNVPLSIAILNKIPWENGVQEIVNADMTVVSRYRHAPTGGLYPFQLAAAQGGRVAVNTTYQLLCAHPNLVYSFPTS